MHYFSLCDTATTLCNTVKHLITQRHTEDSQHFRQTHLISVSI